MNWLANETRAALGPNVVLYTTNPPDTIAQGSIGFSPANVVAIPDESLVSLHLFFCGTLTRVRTFRPLVQLHACVGAAAGRQPTGLLSPSVLRILHGLDRQLGAAHGQHELRASCCFA